MPHALLIGAAVAALGAAVATKLIAMRHARSNEELGPTVDAITQLR